MKKNDSNKNVYIIAIISKVFFILMSLVTSALINRSLGVALKGEYSYITNIVSIMTVLFAFGMGQTYSTYRKEKGEYVLGYFIFITLLQAFLTLILSVLLLSGGFYEYFIIGMLTTTGILKSNMLYYGAIENIKKRDINNIIYKISYLVIVTIAYILFRKSLIAILIITFIEDIIIVAGTFITFKFKIKYKNLIKELNLKKLIKYGALCMIMHSLMTLNYNLDILFLKNIANVYSVGLYSIGVSLANMLWLIPDALKDVLVNKTSRKDSINEIVTVTKYSLYFSLIIIFGFIIFGKFFIQTLYGYEFINSYWCTIILFVGCFSMVIYKLLHPLYIANGQQLYVVKVLIVSVLINITLNILLIPKFNIYGASVSSVFSYSICSMLFLVDFCKKYNKKISDFTILKKGEIKRWIKREKK